MLSTTSTASRLTRGSPPVRRTFVTPRPTSNAVSRVSSAGCIRRSCGSNSTPSAGMQYVQRKLHLYAVQQRKGVTCGAVRGGCECEGLSEALTSVSETRG